MNEFLFFFHIFALLLFILGALRLGKEALITSFAFQVLIANLFITKQMVCFRLHITCVDVYTIGALLSLNMLQEFYGKKVAKQSIWITFFFLFFFVIMSRFHLKYLPSITDTFHKPFQMILSPSFRIVLSSFIVMLIAQLLDVKLYGYFKRKWKGKKIMFSFTAASLISQFVDTFLFSYLALYDLVHSLRDIILISYLIKVGIIFCMAPFTAFLKRLFHDRLQV